MRRTQSPERRLAQTQFHGGTRPKFQIFLLCWGQEYFSGTAFHLFLSSQLSLVSSAHMSCIRCSCTAKPPKRVEFITNVRQQLKFIPLDIKSLPYKDGTATVEQHPPLLSLGFPRLLRPRPINCESRPAISSSISRR